MEGSARTARLQPVTADTFDDTVRAEQDRFAATVVATDPESDYWYWDGFIGGGIAGWSAKSFTIPLPDVAGDGMLRVFLKGAGPDAHPVRVSINGQPLGGGSWNGLTDYELRLPVTGGQLQSGDNPWRFAPWWHRESCSTSTASRCSTAAWHAPSAIG